MLHFDFHFETIIHMTLLQFAEFIIWYKSDFRNLIHKSYFVQTDSDVMIRPLKTIYFFVKVYKMLSHNNSKVMVYC